MGKAAKAKLFPIIAYEESGPVGLFPLFYYKTPVIRYVFSPPLRTGATYLGPVIPDYDKLAARKREDYALKLQRAVESYMSSKLKADFIKVRTAPGLIDSRPFIWTGYNVSVLYNYEIDLTKGCDAIWKGFDKSLVKNIRRAQKNGLTPVEGGKDELNSIYTHLSNRYSNQELSIDTSKEYLTELYEALHPENMRIFTIKKTVNITTGVILLAYKQKGADMDRDAEGRCRRDVPK